MLKKEIIKVIKNNGLPNFCFSFFSSSIFGLNINVYIINKIAINIYIKAPYIPDFIITPSKYYYKTYNNRVSVTH